MNYQKQYANKINWQNTPSISTPLNATNLNKMDNALWYMDDALYVLSNVIAGGSSARGGIITNVGHNIFTTHIDLRSGEDLSTGELLFLRSNVSGSGNGINVYIDESMAVGWGFVDLSGTATSVTLTSSSVLLLMLDAEENTAQVLSVLGEGGGGGGLPETPLAIIHGGTGNTAGYIQTGNSGQTIGNCATIEGEDNVGSGAYSHVEGAFNEATNGSAHAEGTFTLASGFSSHAEGNGADNDPQTELGIPTTASGEGAHAEGRSTTASGNASHTEGRLTVATNDYAHAEGYQTTASNAQAHAEGYLTVASGNTSHAEGARNTASGAQSHVAGRYNTAGYAQQTVVGRCNDNKATTLFEVGNGTESGGVVSGRNAFEVYDDGKASWDNGSTKFQFTAQNGEKGYIDESGTFNAFGGGTTGNVYAGLGEGKMVSFTNNVIDTDIDLHRAPMAGDRLLIWFDTTVQNPTGLTTYNNGTAVTSNLENVTPLYYNAGWNLIEFMNDGLLYNNVWVRKQNVPIPNNTLFGLSDTAISMNPTEGQVLTYNGTTGKWGNQTPSGVAESVVGPVENSTTASKAYAVGEHFIRNDKFCTAIAAIASGATLTLNTNYVEGTIAEALNASNVYSTSEVRIGEWFGQPLYRKCYNITAMPSNNELRISHGLTNVSIIRTYGVFGDGSYNMSMPYASPSAQYCVGIWTNAGNILVRTATTEYTSYSGVAILEYTKNS